MSALDQIRYRAAASLREAEQLLRSEAGARPLAGGTDLFGSLKDAIHGDDAPVTLVDLKAVPGLDGVMLEDREVVIGALTRLADLAADELIAERLPMLAGAARAVASPQLREVGTVGGNLCQEPRCWYYRYPVDTFHCHRKGGELCAAAVGDDRYHSVFGGVRVADPPCTQACPNQTSIPAYVGLLRDLDIESAARALLAQNPMPSITGRICPHFCEAGCSRADMDESVSIHSLEREVGDYILAEPAVFLDPQGADPQGADPQGADPQGGAGAQIAPSGNSVTIVGSGPAGLTAAYYLRRAGHAVTVLERESRAGGALSYGIPPFRLSRTVVDSVTDLYAALGVRFRLGVEVGRGVSLEELRATSDAVIVASGACVASRIGIEGEAATVAGLDYLRQAAVDEQWGETGAVVVIGGGNVAIDSAMTALARGADRVTMICLESRDEMPAFDAEVADALQSGMLLQTGWGPRRIRLEGGAVAGVELVRCSAVFDANGAFCPTMDEAATDFVAADKVILAVGQRVDREWFKDCLAPAAGAAGDVCDVFVCGDAESGPATVVAAIASGREAAASVHRLLTGADLVEQASSGVGRDLLEVDVEGAGILPLALGELPTDAACACAGPAEATNACAGPSDLADDCAGPAEATNACAGPAALSRSELAEEARRCLNCSCVAVSPSDLAPAFVALNATVQTSKRRLAVGELFAASVGASTVLDDDEIVLAVRVPLPGPGDGNVFQKFRERKSVDFPVVNLAVHLNVVDGLVTSARLCAGAVAPVPLRLRAAEDTLVGRPADLAACERAAQAAVGSCRTLVSNAYKRQILEALVRRSLEEAIGLV
jgi:NADPH-dependent glutamate synthase beta subunit-like oxidoreductase/CO/xanthine dehydrogenase FAD-binding subunit